MNTATRHAAILVLLTAVGGCANYTQPRAAPGPQTQAQRNFDAVWRGSIEVLRRYHFSLDRQDRRAGIITTHPMLARHWFEFWRSDAANAFDLAEGTLQTVMRRAVVRVAPGKAEGTYQPIVVVEVTRPDRQGLEIVAAGEAYDKFLDTYGDDDTLYGRRQRQKRLKKDIRYKLFAEGQAAADEAAEEAYYTPRPPETLGKQTTLAEKIAAEIRDEAAKRNGEHRALPDR